LRLLLDLDPEVIPIGRGLHHLQDAILNVNFRLWHENETGLRVQFLPKGPSSALDVRLNATAAFARPVEGNGPAETLAITLMEVSLGIYVATWLLTWTVMAQLIAVCFYLHKAIVSA